MGGYITACKRKPKFLLLAIVCYDQQDESGKPMSTRHRHDVPREPPSTKNNNKKLCNEAEVHATTREHRPLATNPPKFRNLARLKTDAPHA